VQVVLSMVVLIVLGGSGAIVGCGERERTAGEDDEESEVDAGIDSVVDVGDAQLDAANVHDTFATAESDSDDDSAGDVDVRVEDEAEGELDAGVGCERLCARGQVVRDHRRVDDSRTRLLPVEVVPVAGFAVSVHAGAAQVAAGRTDAEGRFELPLVEAPADDVALVFTTIEQLPDEAAPRLAVLDSAGVAVPRDVGMPVVAQRAWAWVVAPVTNTARTIDFGEVHVTEARGAGAIAIFETIERARAQAVATFAAASDVPQGGSADAPPTLAVLWNPGVNVSCIACYLPTGWGPISWHTSAGEVPFDRAMFLSGADSAPLHFTPSLVAHELGHWVMDTYSRFPEAFGSHGWGQLSPPSLAWSEGFATFFAQWSLSSPAHVDSRFFGKQSNVEFWVDLEAVGAGSAAAASSLPVVFQRPTAGGGLTQTLNEAVVAAMLWDLWDASADPLADEDVTLGDLVVTTIAQLVEDDADRGVAGPDLVDMLDALACRVMAPTAWSEALMGFPWDATAACP